MLFVAVLAIVLMQVAGTAGIRTLAVREGWGGGVTPHTLPIADTIPGRFLRWDGNYYLEIAECACIPEGDACAFFPLYPFLAFAFSSVSGLSVPWSGLIISLICFIATGLVMYKWVVIDYDDEVGRLAAVATYLFPMAIFMVAFYAEPLVLLTSVVSAYYARRGQFVLSGFAILIAGASRGTAFLLAIPYVVEFLQQGNFRRNEIVKFIAGGIIAPIGFLAYYLLRGFEVSGEWNTYYTWPWAVFVDGLRAAVFAENINKDWFSRAQSWHDLLYAVLPLALCIWAWPRLRLSASVFMLSSILFFWSIHGPYGYAFWSTPRRIGSRLSHLSRHGFADRALAGQISLASTHHIGSLPGRDGGLVRQRALGSVIDGLFMWFLFRK